MGRLPGIGLTPTQTINIAVTCLLGVLTAAWIGAIFADAVWHLSRPIGIALTVIVGVTVGLLPWGVAVATTPRSQILLLYLTAAVGAGSLGAVLLSGSPELAVSLGGATTVGIGGAWVYRRSSIPDHGVFVGIWLGLLASVTIAVGGFASAFRAVSGLLPALAVVCVVLVLIGTHQVLIDERKRQTT
jgi:hypothetical protein